LTVEQYDAMLMAQGGCCLICGRHQLELRERLNVDRDHATEKVRGLLCRWCNVQLGWLESPNGQAALAYLQKEVA